MKILAASLAFLLGCSTVSGAWTTDQMNVLIDTTNFSVGGTCSGTLISVKEKLILTNYHCIGNSVSSVEREVTNAQGFVRKVKVRKYDDVQVFQNSYEGYTRTGSASYVAEIVAEAQTKDLAILRIKGNIPHTSASALLPEGETVKRLDRVYSVGNPINEYGTAVEGIVSSVNRAYDFPWTAGARLPMIQFSGGIFGGNSGGALYNDQGHLIGVPAAGYGSAPFIGLAIPIEVVKDFMRENCLASIYDASANDKKCRDERAKKAERAEKKDE